VARKLDNPIRERRRLLGFCLWVFTWLRDRSNAGKTGPYSRTCAPVGVIKYILYYNYKLKKMSTSTARYWNSSFFLQRDVFYLATETKTNCFARLVLYVMLPIHGPEILRGKTVQSRPSVFPERLW
jgi:hypothetical protein